LNELLRKVKRVLHTYWERLSAFHPNARLFLLSATLSGAVMGIFRLLFNFYVLSLGFDEVLLGTLVTTNSLTSLLAAIPMGYLSDSIGRKPALILGGLASLIGIAVMIAAPSMGMLLAMSVLIGLGQGLAGVTMGPFLMENSGDKERTYLFSFSSGFTMASAFVGNSFGGYLPAWMGSLLGSTATSTAAYGGALAVVALGAALSSLPLFFLRRVRGTSQRSKFAPIAFFQKEPALLGRLILPMLVTSVGAGMIMPFMNVFFRQEHHLPDPAIGSMFAWGSLAMGAGLMIAPPLAERYGKIQLVVLTQALSIPFLIMLGFAPWFMLSAASYFIRLALMNMSGPIYQTHVMEAVEPGARGTVASLVSMANNFGWALSPLLSGWLQVRYGFGPPFAITVVLYALSTYLYWRFFWRRQAKESSAASFQ
jgi:MFS family permease